MRAGRKLGCCRLAPDLKLRFVINESYTQPSNELPILAQSRSETHPTPLRTVRREARCIRSRPTRVVWQCIATHHNHLGGNMKISVLAAAISMLSVTLIPAAVTTVQAAELKVLAGGSIAGPL